MKKGAQYVRFMFFGFTFQIRKQHESGFKQPQEHEDHFIKQSQQVPTYSETWEQNI